MKYGWEIADEVQRFAGNTADIQFVPLKAFEDLTAERDILKAKQSQHESTVLATVAERDRLRAALEQIRIKYHENDFYGIPTIINMAIGDRKGTA